MHWYKRDPDAAYVGMMCLTLEECGAYNRLIDQAYSRDGNLPNDDKFLARIVQTQERRWKRIRAVLEACGKIWVVGDKIEIKRVLNTISEASEFSSVQRLRAKKHEKTTTEPSQGGSATTSTSTSKLLSSSVTTSEQLQPSAELLEHERKKRSAPGSLATAPFDSALARPAYAAASTKAARDPSTRKFSRAEVGKPNGWDWDEASKEAAEKFHVKH